MTSFRRLPFSLLASACLLLAALFAAPAQAGSLRVRDDAHTLTADDVSRLRSVLAATPFDARLVLTTEYPEAQDLSRFAGSLLTEPNMVAVAVNPEHHHVQVHFGTGSHVPRAEWPAIERAGNDAFRRGDWEGGARAIFQAAANSAAGAAGDVAPAPAEGARPSMFGPGLLLVLLAGGIGIAYLAWRRSNATPYAGPMNGPGGGPYPGQGYPPGYPGGPPQGGMGPLGGGLIGAGLGGLAGYELGKLEGERERGERPFSGAGTVDDERDNFDAGGGGSSWSDDGDSGGGGGFDGGGDSGGGGSDF